MNKRYLFYREGTDKLIALAVKEPNRTTFRILASSSLPVGSYWWGLVHTVKECTYQNCNGCEYNFECFTEI